MHTMPKVFFDTNILLYSIDPTDKKKQGKSRELLEKAEEEGTGVLSTQVLQEYYNISTRKFKVDPLVAKDTLAAFDAHEIVVISPALIHGAIECQVVSRISFWDALIVVAAEAGQCSTIYTEDLNSGQKIRGMKVENPFA
jgi:predicted nucleic acid-binding protein